MQGPPFYLFYMPSGPGSFSLSQRRTYYSNDYAHLYMLFAMLALAEEPTVIPPIYMIPPIVNVCPGGGTHADVKTPLTNKKSTEVAEVTE